MKFTYLSILLNVISISKSESKVLTLQPNLLESSYRPLKNKEGIY